VNILVLHSQVPFTRGGAEVLVSGLVEALQTHGHNVDQVSLPLVWNPVDKLLTSALTWAMQDLTTFNGVEVDLVICTKFPTWAARHPRKVLWLIHQHRQAYDLHGTALSEFGPDSNSRQVRQYVHGIDRKGLTECHPRYGISENVCARLKRYNGIDAAPLYPPVPRSGLRAVSYEPFILSASRIDDAKRVHRLVEAWPLVQADLKLVIVGDGPGLASIQKLVKRHNLGNQVSILGRVSDEQLVDLYNSCRAVFYAPVDEDYGYAAVEALTAGKPVITSGDSGGVLEFIVHHENGLVTSLEAHELARAIDRLGDEALAKELGQTGPERTKDLTWDRVVSSLLGEADGN
jgi:glycosyltransferase involved in cell wall biosynthesis